MNYAATELGHHRDLVLLVGILGGVSLIALVAVSASLSDVLGRRRVILFGYALGLPWSFALIPLLDTGSPILLAVAVVGTYAILGLSYGPLAAFLPEIFATRYRYTGAGLALNLGGVVGGAVPPLIASALHVAFGSSAIALLLAVLVVASMVCTYLLPETLGATLEHG